MPLMFPMKDRKIVTIDSLSLPRDRSASASPTDFLLEKAGWTTGSSNKKKPYKELTLEQKVELIRLAEQNSHLSQASIAQQYGIAKSNVCRILQRKAEYTDAYESERFSGSRKRKLRSDSNSNETLRAHMLKQHQISRMFMCRCCNWAFPDKTSLHMHMMQLQGKQENKSVNVPVIGKGNPPLETDEANSPKLQTIKEEPRSFNQNHVPTSLNASLLGNAFGFGGAGLPATMSGSLFGTPNNDQRSSFASGLHPIAAAMAAAAAAGIQIPTQGPPLFPNLNANPLLNAGPNANPNAMKTNGVGSTGLFPQLSAMQRDNTDLISKLRQRLFCGNTSDLWSGQFMGMNADLNGLDQFKPDARLMSELADNNNDEKKRCLNGKPSEFSGLIGKSKVDQQMNGNAAEQANGLSDLLTRNNIANLMEMLSKKSVTNEQLSNENNNLLLNNNNEEETNNNEETEGSIKTATTGLKSKSLEQPQSYQNEAISPTNTNSSASPSNPLLPCFGLPITKTEVDTSIRNDGEPKSSGSEFDETTNANVRQIREHNQFLMQKLLECRERIVAFMRTEQTESARAEFLRDVLRITLLES